MFGNGSRELATSRWGHGSWGRRVGRTATRRDRAGPRWPARARRSS